jgi:hypothetical protein
VPSITTFDDVERIVVANVQDWPDFFASTHRPPETIEVVSYASTVLGDLEHTTEWITECIALEWRVWKHVVGVRVGHRQRSSPLNRYTGIWGVVDEIPRPQRIATLTEERADGLWLGGVAELQSPREAADFVIAGWSGGQAVVFLDDLSDVQDILEAQARSEQSDSFEYTTRFFVQELVAREVPKRRKVARYWAWHDVSLDIFGLAGDERDRPSRAFGDRPL